MTADKRTIEHRARVVTPIASVITAVMSFAGFPILIWLVIHSWEGFEKRLDEVNMKMDVADKKTEEKTQIFYQRINDLRTKETADVLCLTKGLYQCCGNKAQTNC